MKYFKYATISYKNEIYIVYIVPKTVIKKVKNKITTLCFDFWGYANKEQLEGKVVAVWLDDNNVLRNIDIHNTSHDFISKEFDYEKLKILAKHTMWIDSLVLK